MGNIAGKDRPEVKGKLLLALREGKSRVEAAGIITTPLKTFEGWIDRDDAFRKEVEDAEFVGRELAEIRREEQAKQPARDPKTGADRWRKLREDAARFAPGMLGFLCAVEARLASRPGAHGFSPFWKWCLSEWYASGKPVFLGCIGRGGGKSDTQTAVVVTECIFADRVVPPGETWIWPYLSKDMNETNLKFGPLESALKALGLGGDDLKVHRRKDGRSEVGFVDANSNMIEVRVYPNTKDALRGPTLCGATNDEEAFWRADKDLGTSTADDVLDAMAGAFRGDAKEKKHMRISSANTVDSTLMRDIEDGDNDLHFVARLGRFVCEAVDGFELVASRLFAEGRTDDARTIRQWASSLSESSPWIPSWVGNPTHDIWGGFLRLRKRVAKWLRENGSKPGDGAEEGDYFEPQTIDNAVAAIPAQHVTHPAPMQPNLHPSWDGHVRVKGSGRVYKQDTSRPVHEGDEKILFPRPSVPRLVSTPEHFAAIDTGAKKNPSALAIVERAVINVRGERRYQWRPVVLKEWRRKQGGLPLDLRNDVLPEMASILKQYDCLSWWSDGWGGDAVEIVGALSGIETKYVDTARATQQVYEPLDAALTQDPCPVVLSGCEGIEAAVAQLRQVRRAGDGKAIVPKQGVDHGELGQVLARALAHAGVGQTPPDERASKFVGIPDRYSAFRSNGSRSYR